MNREQLIALNDMADGGVVTFTGEPQFLEDVNGVPLGIDVAPTHTQVLDGITVTAHEVRVAGLTAADLPNLNVIEMRNND